MKQKFKLKNKDNINLMQKNKNKIMNTMNKLHQVTQWHSRIGIYK